MAEVEGADRNAVRRAALRTSVQVAAVSTAVVLAILLLAGLFIVDQSRPSELLERPQRGESKIYVDSHEVVLALIVLGAAAVVVVGAASWAISRRAVEPLGEALRLQRAFVADASHELRTPLAVLHGRLQVLRRRLDRQDAWQDVLDAAQRDTAVMTALVTDLLLLAEASASDGGTEVSDLRQVVDDAVDGLQLLAESRGITLVARVDTAARVRLSDVSLRRAMTVLIDNALTHAPDGSEVTVRAGLERSTVVIRVADPGPGIDPAMRDQLFERFAHGPATGRRRGFGIGLSLVRDLAVRAGGQVSVESTGAEGTVMRLDLPIVR